MGVIIEVEHLSKTYGEINSLCDVSFTVNGGEIFGIIGPDGAGKTTAIRLLCALLRPTNGEAKILGMDAAKEREKLKEHIGYMPQKFSLYEELSIVENLNFFATVYGYPEEVKKEKIEFFLELTELTAHRKKQAGQLSGGMKQKLALAVNLIHQPQVLFLDEPTTGVDPVARKDFWDILKKMQKEGVTIVVATPYMEEAERCNRMVLLNKGELLAEGSKENIIDLYPYKVIKIECNNPFATKRALEGICGVIDATIYGNDLHVMTVDQAKTISEIIMALPGLEGQVYPIEPSIEDAFIYLIGKENGGDGNGLRS